ncbi:isochorismatase family protein [Nonomuraea phyllanthi]|uniref:Isochorismatase family protein n=1 Tax=Nonomuraea phyllanthi TaxID=2219224 RepID=A0A5C4VHU8_9ACTN|nr:isochorismatase family protein [Nonomuraea phyllanthi]
MRLVRASFRTHRFVPHSSLRSARAQRVRRRGDRARGGGCAPPRCHRTRARGEPAPARRRHRPCRPARHRRGLGLPGLLPPAGAAGGARRAPARLHRAGPVRPASGRPPDPAAPPPGPGLPGRAGGVRGAVHRDPHPLHTPRDRRDATAARGEGAASPGRGPSAHPEPGRARGRGGAAPIPAAARLPPRNRPHPAWLPVAAAPAPCPAAPDLQRDFVADIAGTTEVLPAVRRLADVFRREGRPVVHIVRLYLPDGSNAEQQIGPNEHILYKPRWSAFFRTRLLEHLAERAVSTVVVAGCNYPNCPRSTLVDATQHDLRTVAVRDAVSGWTADADREMTGMGIACLDTSEVVAAIRTGAASRA